MFKMRSYKLPLLLLALILVVGLMAIAGCEDPETVEEVEEPEEAVEEEEEEIEEAAPVDKKDVSWSITSSASGWYAWKATYASLVNENSDLINVTAVEAGGAQEAFEMMLEDMILIGNSNSLERDKAAAGEGIYAPGHPELRALVLGASAPNNLAVRADSGIESFSDLEGKRINPGGMGTATEQITQNVLEVLGIEPDYQFMGMDDAIDALRDGHIDGFFKTAATPDAPDAVIQELQMTADIRTIGLTEEEADMIRDANVAFIYEVPAGTYDNQDEELLAKGTAYVSQTKKDNLTREEAYDFAYVGFTMQHKLEDTTPGPVMEDIIEVQLAAAPYYWHAGVIDLLLDLGYELDELPEEIIPPEFYE